MAICDTCNQEMKTADGCTGEKILIRGKEYDPIEYDCDYQMSDDECDPIVRCHDCKVLSGQFHHPGCDMERCPKCGGQIISCGCLGDSWDDEDYKEDDYAI